MKLCISLFNFNAQTIVVIPLYRVIITLCIDFLIFLLYLIIKYLKIHFFVFETMSKKNKTILITNFIVAILAITIQFVITGFYMKNLPWYIVISSNISLIAYFLLSIYSLIRTTQLEVTSLDLAQEKENNKI